MRADGKKATMHAILQVCLCRRFICSSGPAENPCAPWTKTCHLQRITHVKPLLCSRTLVIEIFFH